MPKKPAASTPAKIGVFVQQSAAQKRITGEVILGQQTAAQLPGEEEQGGGA